MLWLVSQHQPPTLPPSLAAVVPSSSSPCPSLPLPPQPNVSITPHSLQGARAVPSPTRTCATSLYPPTSNSPLVVFHSRYHCTRCSFSTNYRSCFVAHEQKFQYVSPSLSLLFPSPPPPTLSPPRPRVMRTCKDAPSCSFRYSDPSEMVRHRRLFHHSELRPFIVITPESVALDEAIACLTNLAIGQAGPSLPDSFSPMVVDED
ncbi:hypothetical protein EDD18DRAFT_223069 [Armillaria luteobubalina]|uniref:C2H2-type domain-containing protein n=1 Tax=Armillaria luteobubalina TaxID=153913 RepID=A0AA39Q4A6_9AGAR|nr:hypothetical protein EDD18DRAFT_223069 [Armillaria luteobubalina]